MKNRKKKFHLAQFLVHGPTYHNLAMWRHPRTEWSDDNRRRPELYQHIAPVCERGLFDTVFFADLNYVPDSYKGCLEPALRYATQAPEHDPIPLLTMMAAVTSRIGLGATFSTSYQHPFYAARLWATLDHLTGGRAAWNVVTSLNQNQAANYGQAALDPSELHYEKAHEFIEVCQQLWIGHHGHLQPCATRYARGSGVGCRTTSRPASVRIGIAPMPTKCPPTPVNATWLDGQDKVN